MLRKLIAMIPRDERHRSMWKNFVTAIGLLTVAMISALYSSSAGRDGRVMEAGVAAILALGIAVWVGLKFVPRLARGVDWDWIPFLSHYKVTKEGWIYFGAITIVILAAINTSNNLLYMVLSALLAVLLLSGFLSALNFRFIHFDIRIPENCFAGEIIPLAMHAVNTKRVFSSFSILAEPADSSPLHFRP